MCVQAYTYVCIYVRVRLMRLRASGTCSPTKKLCHQLSLSLQIVLIVRVLLAEMWHFDCGTCRVQIPAYALQRGKQKYCARDADLILSHNMQPETRTKGL